jgi:lipoyl(octanoyl) transferase
MSADAPTSLLTARDTTLQVYLLGTVAYEAALALQRRLVYEVSCERNTAALVVCEHPPLLTVGREGSRWHIHYEPEELQLRRWPVRWVNRGGGCLLHLPGQLAIYPILPLDRLELGVPAYLDRLQAVLADVLGDYMIRSQACPQPAALWAGDRPIAVVGAAVRDWVSYHGAFLNVNPDLLPYRRVLVTGAPDSMMTSLERERRGPLRMALVRERLLEHFAARFGFDRTALFTEHPSLSRNAIVNAISTRP